MVIVLTFFWDDEYGFSTVAAGAILGNECENQREKYIALLQGCETTAGVHYRSWILCT